MQICLVSQRAYDNPLWKPEPMSVCWDCFSFHCSGSVYCPSSWWSIVTKDILMSTFKILLADSVVATVWSFSWWVCESLGMCQSLPPAPPGWWGRPRQCRVLWGSVGWWPWPRIHWGQRGETHVLRRSCACALGKGESNLNPTVYSSTIHNSKNMETSPIRSNRWKRQTMLHLLCGILYTYRNKRNLTVCNKVVPIAHHYK